MVSCCRLFLSLSLLLGVWTESGEIGERRMGGYDGAEIEVMGMGVSIMALLMMKGPH